MVKRNLKCWGVSNPEKWASPDDGPWEIAKMFMSLTTDHAGPEACDPQAQVLACPHSPFGGVTAAGLLRVV